MAKTTTRKSKPTSKNPVTTKKSSPVTRGRPRKTPVKSTRAKRTTKRTSKMPRFSWQQLSTDRKLDIIGVLLALVGFLTLLSLASSERGTVTGAWIGALNKIAGWGTFILPIALVGVGMWMVFRNLEQLPQLSGERLAGIIMLYLNLLTWLHYAAGGGYEKAAEGIGGGYVGAFFQGGLMNALGVAGGVIVMIAWFIVAIVFTFDLSLVDITHRLQDFIGTVFRGLRRGFSSQTTSHRHYSTLDNPLDPLDLPNEFHPLPGQEHAVLKTRRKPSPSQGDIPVTIPAKSSPPAKEHRDVPTHRTVAGQSSAAASLWKLPAIEEILDPATPSAQQTHFDQERAKLIEETLASFDAPGHVVDISHGPTITRFGVEPDFVDSRSGRMRVRVSKIASLSNDLALALAASRIRIQAPVPGRNYIGIEVPNTEISLVAMREVLESDAFRKIRSLLRFTLGKDVAGKPIAADLGMMPHLLIAGTTGSGKSVCVNSILTCLLLTNTPATLRLVLVDPKRVELTGYNGIPHLLAPVVVDTERVIGALQWLQREMDARYHKFSQAGVRNIDEYNKKQPDKLPYLVTVVDELADLMMLSPDETEKAITRLAQLARATGIHLILATQRPSTDVVTGLIKANFPARVAFAVPSGVDSRVILDQMGAESLLGRGDMLFQSPDAAAPVRLQGVFVSDIEIQRLVDYWHTQSVLIQSESPQDQSQSVDLLPAGIPLKQGELWEMDQGGDALLSEAVELVRREGRASITMLQRRLRVGYTRAARMIDEMEEQGIISPALPHSQVREVLDYGDNLPPVED